MQKSIAAARKNDASVYAKKEFAECLKLYNSSMKEWKLQNEKWIMKRNFTKLKNLVKLTTEKAIKSNKKAIETTGSLTQYIDKNITELKRRDINFRTKYKFLPLEKKVFKEYSTAQLKLLESIENAKRNDFLASYSCLVEAENGFSNIETEAKGLLKSYFKDFKQWEKWYNNVINNSRSNGSYAIIVDKMAHICFLVKDGKVIRQYDAELSQKWIGNKLYQGDNATPEGEYFITKKLDSKNTKFYKALLINYPNENDKKRYAEAVRSKAISHSVKIGGLIEIHGEGGKGKDWTNGCVALTNKDMDHLFSIAKTGFPVLIIGSITPLNELFSE